MRISFNHVIFTALEPEQLWQLLVQSFRSSDESPIWPHEFESVHSERIEQGALVRAVYQTPAGGQSRVTYRFGQIEPGRRLSYVAEPSHPLRGGGTVEVAAAPAGSELRWYGEYQIPWRPQALVAAVFTRFFFEGRFFSALARNLSAYRGP